MENHINNPQQGAYNTKTKLGIGLLAFGSLVLVNRLGIFLFPHWLFSWPLLLIAFGLYTGVKSDFRKTSWILLTGIGVLFLLPNIIPSLSFGLLLPVVMIIVGISIVTRRKQRWNGSNWEKI